MEASRATAPSAFELGGVRQVVADYVTLTKPKVQLLLLLTTVTTMYVAGDPSLSLVALTLLGGSLSAGGAAAVNHYWDRDIDAAMAPHRHAPGAVRPDLAARGADLRAGAAGAVVRAAGGDRQPAGRRSWRWPGSSATCSSTRSGSSAARRRTS